MPLKQGYILDFPWEKEIQAEIIECFKGEEDEIFCFWIEPNEEDLREYSDWETNPYMGIKDAQFIVDEQQKYTDEKVIHRVYYYAIGSHEELIQEIKREGIILGFYTVRKGKDISEYEYWIHTYEHNFCKEDRCEHYSLFYEIGDVENFENQVVPKLQDKFKKYNLELLLRS